MTVRVLVIDDELYARRLLEMIFERCGYEVISANSGIEGLELLKQHEIHAITCDLMMPVMNGMQFLKRVLSTPEIANIPVVLITAAGTEEDLDRACQQGAAGALIKPFSERQLVQMVQGVIARSQKDAE